MKKEWFLVDNSFNIRFLGRQDEVNVSAPSRIAQVQNEWNLTKVNKQEVMKQVGVDRCENQVKGQEKDGQRNISSITDGKKQA